MAEEQKPKLQTITIVNPNDPTRQAILNIWFIGKDIVLGGIGWIEYYDYEEQKKREERAKNFDQLKEN